MKILGFRTIQGPNVYHSKAVLMMRLNLEQWADKGSHELPGFNERLLKALPGLQQHGCSPGHAGGFCERLERGTYMAHIVEHMAIEISQLAGCTNTFGKSVYAGEPGVYHVIVRFQNEEGMKFCLETAVEMLQRILEGTEFDLSPRIEDIRRTISRTRLGPSTQALCEAAHKRGIPVRRLGSGNLLELGYGKYRRRLQTAVSDRTSLISTDLVQDKQFTKELLQDYSIPVPHGFVISTEEELLKIAESFAGPYAVKPLDGHHGNGVNLNLKTREDLFKAFYIAKEFCSDVIVEEMCQGRDYRVLVVGGRFVAAAERIPPQVLGDGKKTIRELIEILNQDPRRGEGHESTLTKVELDEILLETLKKQELSLESVPETGKLVVLRGNANLSSGGTAKDVTDTVHPEIRSICERISRLVGLDICGVDIIAQDLALPLNAFFKVIEVNAGPGLRMHLAPSEGEARKVGEDILEMIYPLGSPSRIPIVAVTGTNGKTTTVRLIHKILSADSTVGLTTSDGVYIGNEKIATGDTTGPISARMVLSDPAVEKAVLEVARGGILRRGLAYDWSDVGIVTNIRPDHIGQDGIETLDDLVWIKSLVAERVKEDGTLVLNADDEMSLSLKDSERIQRIKRNILLYSTNSANKALQAHLKQGGDAAWNDDGWLYLQMQGRTYRLVSAENLSFTFNGKADFQVSNALAAVAATAALGATPDQIVMGLMSFQAYLENHGRLNLYKVGEGYVILDYGHNPDAIQALGQLLSNWQNSKKTAVFGLPGDRADEILRMSVEKMIQYFETLVVRDDHDLRGRKPGEVPVLIEKWVKDFNRKVQCRKAVSEREAVESVLDQISKNEIVVIFYDSFDSIMPLIRQYDPIPISRIPPMSSQESEKRMPGIKDIAPSDSEHRLHPV